MRTPCAPLVFSQHVPGKPWRATARRDKPWVEQAAGAADSGWAASRAGSGEDGQSEDAELIMADVHFMMAPWSIGDGSNRTRFKITGLNSC